MPVESCSEYDTIVVGAAYLVKGILQRLGFVSLVDEALQSEPMIETTYGNLAQIIVANQLTFQPVPLYHLGAWAEEHGMTHVFGIEAEWLDDDRLGALLEGLADHQVSIWSSLVGNALRHYKIAPEFLHADTTSVYFEGQYEDENGQPRQEEGERVPMLVEGYNKAGHLAGVAGGAAELERCRLCQSQQRAQAGGETTALSGVSSRARVAG